MLDEEEEGRGALEILYGREDVDDVSRDVRYPDLASDHGSDDQEDPPAEEASTKVKPSDFRRGVRPRSLCSCGPHPLDRHERI